MHFAAAGQLLTATLVTEPFPLAVSTPSKLKTGVIVLRFGKAPDAPPVKCRKITVTTPVGTAPTDLTDDTTRITTNYASLNTASKGAIWQLSGKSPCTCTPSGGLPGTAAVFTFDGGAYFELRLTIPVSRLPGIAALAVIAEVTTSTAANPPATDWETQDMTAAAPPVTKSADEFFYFRAFSATTPQVDNGGTATLRWEGSENDTEYWLSWGGRAPMLVTGQSTQVTGLTDTTTFVLDARAKDPGSGAFDQHHYLSTTVTVNEPTIDAKTLTASKITVPGTLTADSSTQTTTALGPATFEGDATIMGNLTVKGVATVASLDASNGEIKTSGALTTGAATFNGDVTVAGEKKLVVTGPTELDGRVQAGRYVTGGNTCYYAEVDTTYGALWVRREFKMIGKDANDYYIFFNENEAKFLKNVRVADELKVDGLIEATYGITGEKRTGGNKLQVHYNGLQIHTNLEVSTSSGTANFYGNTFYQGRRVLRTEDIITLRSTGNNGRLYRPGNKFDVDGGNARYPLVYGSSSNPEGDLYWRAQYDSSS